MVACMREKYAWITAVQGFDGKPHDLDFEKDIYAHILDWEKVGRQMRDGREVEFSVRSDERRGGKTLRAYDITPVSDECSLFRLMNGGITLSLQSGGANHVLESPNAFMSWCLSKDLLGKIKERVATKGEVAQLLVIVTKSGDFSEHLSVSRRKLVNLNDPMTMIDFRSSGENRVTAAVVFGDSEKDIRRRFLSLDCGFYKSTVMGSEGTFIASYYVTGSGCVDVDVPEELFAKEPFDWDWVNRFFESKPRDQCAFRRRRLFAYTVQPFVVSVVALSEILYGALRWAASFVVAVALLSVGMRGLNWKPLLHPMDHAPTKVLTSRSKSIFNVKAGELELPIFFVFSPLFLSGIVAAVIAVSLRIPSLVVSMIFVMSVAFCGLFALTLGSVWNAFATRKHNNRPSWMQRRLEKARQKQEWHAKQVVAELDALACSGEGRSVPSVTELPFTPKTIRFYAAALKQKVCRGYAN